MALSDCSRCYDTPCRCGHQYADWSKQQRLALARSILNHDYNVIKDDMMSRMKQTVARAKSSDGYYTDDEVALMLFVDAFHALGF